MRDIKGELQQIFRDLFDLDDLVLRDDMTAKDVEGWDSINNVRLVVHIEKHFKIRFSTGEVVSLRNVGELVQLIRSRCG